MTLEKEALPTVCHMQALDLSRQVQNDELQPHEQLFSLLFKLKASICCWLKSLQTILKQVNIKIVVLVCFFVCFCIAVLH